MTPGARVAAAIGILDAALADEPAEAALTRWGRASRYAGSGDRAAVRDLVYDSLRRLRSRTALAGAALPSGRALMIGALREAGTDPALVFSGEGHAPAPLSPQEAERAPRSPTGAEALDIPDWTEPLLRPSLGLDLGAVARAMRDRAPVILRINIARIGREEAAATLAQEGIPTRLHPAAKTALEVIGNAGKIRLSRAYLDGLVELQDAAPQAACEALAVRGRRVLDYCAGGGGKALALAALGARVAAHDAAPARMRDLDARALRAGVSIPQINTSAARASTPWDLVVVDVPCSGSGTWRRTPEAKWRLTPEGLDRIGRVQAEILEEARRLAGDSGDVAYMTCSLFDQENGARVRAFLQDAPGWRLAAERLWTPLDHCDGFYLARLTRG